jgi:hypothetical protein
MKILLVSNGPSVLKEKRGEEIDSFDKVVRFNNFDLAGKEEYVGRKTHIVSRRCCDDVLWHNPPELEKVYCFMTYCKWSGAMGIVSEMVKNYYYPRCELVKVSKCKEYGELVGLDQPNNEWATVGILTILHLLNIYPVLYLYGFDYSNLDKHYFARQPRDSKYHSAIKEKKYLDKLVKEEKCILL